MSNVSPGKGMITLLAVALIAAIMVSKSYDVSRDRIVENERAYLLARLREVASADLYTNDLAAARFEVTDEDLLGSENPVDVYMGTRDGDPTVLIFTPTAPDGYNGDIRLLIAIGTNGKVTGVRATTHRETPGLGDAIDANRSDWILGFNGRSLSDPTPERWLVRADGGHFDQLTGATVTPRAIIKAVRNTLKYFEENRDMLLTHATVGAGPDE